MKKAFFLLVVFGSAVTFASAQNTEFEYIKTQFKQDKKTLLMNYLKLNDANAGVFWPIYSEYETERGALADKRFANLRVYASQYNTITDDQAETFGKVYFENGSKEISLEKKYYEKVKKALGAKTALAWLQFEEYIDAAVKFQVLDSVPFLNE